MVVWFRQGGEFHSGLGLGQAVHGKEELMQRG